MVQKHNINSVLEIKKDHVFGKKRGPCWWTIRGSNWVELFRRNAVSVEKKGVDIVYGRDFSEVYPKVYPRKEWPISCAPT
jgi:hypothetical protein